MGATFVPMVLLSVLSLINVSELEMDPSSIISHPGSIYRFSMPPCPDLQIWWLWTNFIDGCSENNFQFELEYITCVRRVINCAQCINATQALLSYDDFDQIIMIQYKNILKSFYTWFINMTSNGSTLTCPLNEI